MRTSCLARSRLTHRGRGRSPPWLTQPGYRQSYTRLAPKGAVMHTDYEAALEAARVAQRELVELLTRVLAIPPEVDS